MTVGITPSGFAIETVDEVRQNMVQDLQARLGVSLDVGDRSVVGQVFAILADRVVKCHELAQAVYNAQNPDTATEDALVNLCALSGTIPLQPVPSRVVLTLTGNTGTVIAAGKQCENQDGGTVFALDAVTTLVAAAAWAFSAVHSLGDYHSNVGNMYICTTAGTGGPADEPTGTGSAIAVGTSVYKYLGPGIAYANAASSCTENGPVSGLSGTITQIKTPVSGWLSAQNLLDADLGRLEEPNESLRIRREAELTGAGSHTVNALRADILQYLQSTTSNTIQATIFQNTSEVVVDSMPPHTIEALIRGGDNQVIGDLLLDRIGLGYATTGNVSVNSVDSQGFTHVIKFSRPTLINIYVDINVTVDAATAASDVDEQIKSAIVNYGDKQATGKDAVPSAISAQAFGIVGVLAVTNCAIGTTPVTLLSTIAIALRELAVYDTSRINVLIAYGTP